MVESFISRIELSNQKIHELRKSDLIARRGFEYFTYRFIY